MRPVFVILPGATANRHRLDALQSNARKAWPEARIEVPDYLSRGRGIRGVGAWLDRWCEKNLRPEDEFFVFAFILGAAALPHAPRLLSRTSRIVVLRSPFQEGISRLLVRRLTSPLTALLFGRSVADLGTSPFLPAGFALAIPTLTLIETRPTSIARRLRITPQANSDLGIDEGIEIPIDHDSAYSSLVLMQGVVGWLKTGTTVQLKTETTGE